MRRPLLWVAVGVAVVAMDVRTSRLDLLADPIGWGLVAYGAARLSMTPVVWAAASTAALSVVDVQLPYRFERIDPDTGAVIDGPTGGRPLAEHLVFDPVSGWRLAAVVTAAAASGVTLWLLLATLERRARGDDRSAATRLAVVRWLLVVVWLVPSVVVLAATGDAVWNGAALELVALAGLAVVATAIALLVRGAEQGWGLHRHAAA